MLSIVYSFRVVRPSLRAFGRLKMSSASVTSHKIAFMFPGQGAQTVGMGATLYKDLPAAKDLYDRASEILGYSLIDKCTNGPKSELDSTAVAQPAIFVSSLAALEKLKLENPDIVSQASVAMGLSLGEYTALCFAGAFSFEDGVKLTKARGEAMQAAADAVPSGMLAIVGLSSTQVQAMCEEAAAKSNKDIAIANYLVDGNYVISGDKEACAVAQQLAPNYKARMVAPLAVAGAFHTKFMEPAVDKLRHALAAVEIKSPRISVISNVDARAHFDPNDIRDVLTRQVTQPVQWETTIRNLVSSPDFVKAYEIGPGTVCRGILKRFGKDYEVVNVSA